MEDAALNYSVSEIEELFKESLKKTHNKLDDNLARPVTADITVFHHFKSVAKGIIAPTLLRKACQYSASIISTAAKLNKSTLVLGTSDAFVYVASLLKNSENLLSPREYFREYLLTDADVERQTQDLISVV